MLRGYRRSYRKAGRCLVVVLLAVTLAGAADAQRVGNNSGGQSGSQVAQPAPQQDLIPALAGVQRSIDGIARAIDSVNANTNTDEDSQREKDDLLAQQEMAKWARLMFYAAAISTILTLAGVILLGFTLAYTKWTLDEAKNATKAALSAVSEAEKTTKAAEASVNVTRDIGEAQVRAYVRIADAKLEFTTSDGHPLIQIFAANSGQSPARNFVWSLTIQYVGGDRPKMQRTFDKDWKSRSGIEISSTGKERVGALIPEMPMRAFASKKQPGGLNSPIVRLMVEFEYLDVFNKRIPNTAYFVGVVSILASQETASDGLVMIRARESLWECNLYQTTRPDDWDSNA
jgi:hypothetical protein